MTDSLGLSVGSVLLKQGGQPTETLHLIVGLGNPGQAYRHTRHNIGFRVVDALAETHRIQIDRADFDAQYGRGTIADRPVLLAKPQSFMNRSGIPVQQLAQHFGISGKAMIVIHDDIDLAFGRLKIKEKGGFGGHRGVRSVMDAVGGGNFMRIRIGIGRPAEQDDVVDYVLGRFTPSESMLLAQIIEHAQAAVVTILSQGIREGMNRFNDRRIQTSS
jgi:PTH1 family peptidyl-tRNA hydrolase